MTAASTPILVAPPAGAGAGSDAAAASPQPTPKFSDPSWLLVTSSLALWLWGVSRIELTDMSDAGLVSVLGWQIPAALAVLGLAFTLSLVRPSHRYLLATETIVLVLMVQGIPSLAEPHPSYFTAYLHVGFVDEILRNGHTVPSLDARFNWPGSFALGALITAGGGQDSALGLVRWSPVVFNLAYLAPLWLIGRSLVADTRARWMALWIFVTANWVHQDYFSPQAEAYFLYLVVIAVVLRYLSATLPVGSAEPRWLGPTFVQPAVRAVRAAGPGSTVVDGRSGPVPADTLRFLLRALVVVLAAMVASHQLTPFAVILVVGALVLVGTCRAVHLPVVVMVLFAAWFSVGATTWWSSHLGELLGGLGQFGDNASSGLLERLGGSDLRAAVLWLRVAFSAAMLIGAGLVGLVLWRRGSPPVAALAILLPPFALIGGQSYGGEVLLRAYLFALPAAALLVARGLARALPPGRAGVALMTLALTFAALAGITVRFGNEHFEQVTGSERAAVNWVYQNVPPGTVLIAPTRNLPWRYRDLTTYHYEPIDEQALISAQAVLDLVPAGGHAYLISTAAQQSFGEQLAFLPPGWLDSITDELVKSGRAAPVFTQGDATVYRLDGQDQT